jgi:hypothetical protein
MPIFMSSYSTRSLSMVRDAFLRSGVKLWPFSKRNIARLPSQQYEQLLELPERFPHLNITRIIVPDFEFPERIDFDNLPEKVIVDCTRSARIGSGRVLNLKRLPGVLAKYNESLRLMKKIEAFRPPPQIDMAFPDQDGVRILNLIHLIRKQREEFNTLFRGRTSLTVQDILNKIEQDRSALGFKNAVLTYPNPDRSGRWIRTAKITRPKMADDGFAPETGGQEPSHTIRSLINHRGNEIVFVVDIARGQEWTFNSQGLERSPNADADLRHFKGPTEMIFVKLTDGREVVAIMQLTNRVYRVEPGVPENVLPEDDKLRAAMLTELETYFRDANQALRRVRGRKLIDTGRVTPEDLGTPYKLNQYHETSERENFLGYEIEVNYEPTLNFEQIQDYVILRLIALAERCIGTRISFDEMRKHSYSVSNIEIVWDGDREVGFGTSRHFPITNHRGNRETLTLLSGTMVDPDYRRSGLMIKLNYDLIKRAKEAVRVSITGIFSWFRRLIVPAPIVVRTQSKAVLEACSRHFKGVKKVGSKPNKRYQHMIDFLANREEEKIELDEHNVQRGAYDEMRVRGEEDLIPGLGSHDAYVFAGDFTAWKESLTWLYINVWYPLKSWVKKRG